MFDKLTNEQKETLLKAFALFAAQGSGKVEFLFDFAKYAAEGFDTMVETEVTDTMVIFTRKGATK